MRIQLVFAPFKDKVKLSDLVHDIYPPLGILYLAAHLRKQNPGLEIKATDGLHIGWENTLSAIAGFSPDMLFISYITPCAESAYKLGSAVKLSNDRIKVVYGGPHATTLPLEPFKKGAADFVAIGEGEVTATELVEAVRRGNSDFSPVNGLCWKNGETIVRNAPRDFISNLDDIPFPARDLLDTESYKGWHVCRQTPDTSMLFSRGCPFDCTFCTNSVWKSSKPWMRYRSPKNIADEMEELKAHGIREVFDNGDEFNSNLRMALAVCDEINKRKLGMTWKCQVRAAPMTEDLARAMAQAGCWYVHLGIESANDRTLKGIRKHITLEQVENTCLILKRNGIKVFGLFMLFNAWDEDGEFAFEGVKESLKTVDYARRLIDRKLVDYISSTITTPYPGSRLFEICQSHGAIKSGMEMDWDRWLTDESFMIDLPGVTRKEAGSVYFRASLIKAYCYLKSGNLRMKDIPLFANKFARASMIRIEGLFK